MNPFSGAVNWVKKNPVKSAAIGAGVGIAGAGMFAGMSKPEMVETAGSDPEMDQPTAVHAELLAYAKGAQQAGNKVLARDIAKVIKGMQGGDVGQAIQARDFIRSQMAQSR